LLFNITKIKQGKVGKCFQRRKFKKINIKNLIKEEKATFKMVH